MMKHEVTILVIVLVLIIFTVMCGILAFHHNRHYGFSSAEVFVINEDGVSVDKAYITYDDDGYLRMAHEDDFNLWDPSHQGEFPKDILRKELREIDEDMGHKDKLLAVLDAVKDAGCLLVGDEESGYTLLESVNVPPGLDLDEHLGGEPTVAEDELYHLLDKGHIPVDDSDAWIDTFAMILTDDYDIEAWRKAASTEFHKHIDRWLDGDELMVLLYDDPPVFLDIDVLPEELDIGDHSVLKDEELIEMIDEAIVGDSREHTERILELLKSKQEMVMRSYEERE